MKLLLVEDNMDIADVIFDYFDKPDVILDYAATGNQALTLANQETYDCIILDIMLPGIDGESVCELLRSDGNNTPIIMLTARDTNTDILSGFKSGADDYVVKPFELEVLEARIDAVMRRAGNIGFQNTLDFGPLKVNTDKREVFREGNLVKLNPTSYSILLLLLKRYPQAVTREDFEREIWKDEPPDEDVLRKHVYHLRQVLDKPFSSALIKTLPKFGYSIEFTK